MSAILRLRGHSSHASKRDDNRCCSRELNEFHKDSFLFGGWPRGRKKLGLQHTRKHTGPRAELTRACLLSLGKPYACLCVIATHTGAGLAEFPAPVLLSECKSSISNRTSTQQFHRAKNSSVGEISAKKRSQVSRLRLPSALHSRAVSQPCRISASELRFAFSWPRSPTSPGPPRPFHLLSQECG